MAIDEPWAAEVEHIYNSIHPITERDDELLRDADYSEEQLREAFYEGFIDKDGTADERHDGREQFFHWMEYLGYDETDFDWNEWADWAGYGSSE
jgi:hypothetical protein